MSKEELLNTISRGSSGDPSVSHVWLNGRRVFSSPSNRDCDMFDAELRARIALMPDHPTLTELDRLR